MKNNLHLTVITITYIFILFIQGYNSHLKAQQIIITDDTLYTTPASGAMLDVKSVSKGLMLPRVDLDSTDDVTTVVSPTQGLIVYNTGNGLMTTKGLYYWTGTYWTRVLSGGNSEGSGLLVADDGTVTLKGDATVWNDLVIAPYNAKSGATGNAPTWEMFKNNGSASRGVYTYFFDDVSVNNEQEVFFQVQMPHNWKEGSAVEPHIHWSPMGATTGSVVWGLEYTWVEYNSSTPLVFSNTTIVTLTTTSVISGDAGKHFLNDFSDITPTTSQDQISSILMCRLFRNSSSTSDTYAAKVALLSFDFHYEIDAFGSSEEYSK